MKRIKLDRKSIRIQLASAFILTSIIPILLVNIIYYYNIFYMYPDDPVCWEVEDEYFYGPDVLVAPVLYAKQRTRIVYLPKGERWVEYATGKEYEGGQTIEADAPLDIIPVFIKTTLYGDMAKL